VRSRATLRLARSLGYRISEHDRDSRHRHSTASAVYAADGAAGLLRPPASLPLSPPKLPNRHPKRASLVHRTVIDHANKEVERSRQSENMRLSRGTGPWPFVPAPLVVFLPVCGFK